MSLSWAIAPNLITSNALTNFPIDAFKTWLVSQSAIAFFLNYPIQTENFTKWRSLAKQNILSLG
ncbi:hypothetical protein [Chroococcidiopsis sp. CCMEE 29]|uniref:hypothetical protein n=1 Tax=Chroococcidiopsis sp. CCMEE 29 TaxID=155894 RepID=UPI002021A5D2|nr:hypothetical protein [Chroococcidiopsis sp. CCMEE 29]